MNDKLEKIIRASREPLPTAPKNEYRTIVEKQNNEKRPFIQNLKKLFLIPIFATILLFFVMTPDDQEVDHQLSEPSLTYEDFMIDDYTDLDSILEEI